MAYHLGKLIRHNFGSLRSTFQMDSPFFCPHPFFREVLCTRNKSANKLRINLKSDSPFLSDNQKMENNFLFFKSSPGYVYI